MDILDNIRIISTAAISISAVIFVILERMFPYDKHQKIFREGFFTDFFWYTIFQSYILGVVISYLIQFIDYSTGLSRFHFIRDLSIWIQLLIFFVVHDFYIYWFHRLQHHSKILWRTHEAHHSVKDVDWLAGSRSHALEILINQTIEFAPIVLFASPETAVIKGMIDAIWGMFIHSNLNVTMGKLRYIINGPELHRWHHADQVEAYNKNFSTKLAVWDYLFSTVYLPEETRPQRYGLSDVRFPSNYFVQQIFAFRPLKAKKEN